MKRLRWGHWQDREIRKSFLLSLAKEKGFDPMIAANWKGKASMIRANQVPLNKFEEKQNLTLFIKGWGIIETIWRLLPVDDCRYFP